MKLCRTCRYGNEYELDKPCIVYREDCPLYQKVGDGMTNEKAIEELKGIKSAYSNKQQFHEACLMRSEHEALDMAIKALEQEPKTGHWIMPVQDDGMSDPIYYQVRCSKCGFDLDPQTWHMELHQYGADKYCPRCGSKMYEDKGILEQLAEKQNSLSATNKAWSEAIDKNGDIY